MSSSSNIVFKACPFILLSLSLYNYCNFWTNCYLYFSSLWL